MKMLRAALVGLAVFVVGIVAALLLTGREYEGGPGGQWKYPADELREAATAPSIARELRRFPLTGRPTVMAARGDILALGGDDRRVAWYTLHGGVEGGFEASDRITALAMTEDRLYVGVVDHVEVYDRGGRRLASWPVWGQTPLITGIAAAGDRVWVADAGNDVVHVCTPDGERLRDVGGPADEGTRFIIPSPYFDLVPDADGAVWIVNPGRHRVERHLADGVVSGVWGQPGLAPAQFSGCCNPAHVDRLPDGRFVTVEKGLQRIKVYSATGDYLGMIAGPDSFRDDHSVPDVAVPGAGEILVLDPSANQVRVYTCDSPEAENE